MGDKLKILFLGDPDSANTLAWIDGLRAQGCEVAIATTRPTPAVPDAWPIGPSGAPARIRILLGKKDVRRAIERFKPDAMIAYRVTSYGYLAAKTGFHPLIIAAQNEQITYLRYPSAPLTWFLGRCARAAIAGADLLHAWGNNIRDGLKRFGADESKILVLHRGIDLSLFSGDPTTRRAPDVEAPVFLSTRSLAREYRIDQAIRSFKLLLKDIPGARLDIVGDGDERQRLEAFVHDLRLDDRVKFWGRLPRQAVAERLRQSDIYISLIETEGVSSSLVESCAAGLTPIVADMPASRDLIAPGVNGFLVQDIHSPAQIAETMVTCARALDLRRSAAAYNIRMVREKFDRERNLRTFVERYRALAGKGAVA